MVNLNQELAIMEVSGADSATYLQGQLTNDISLLDKQDFQYSAHLNNKGRILASFIIVRIAAGVYHLISNEDIIDKTLPRLQMYVMRSKVCLRKLEHSNIVFTDYKPNSSTYSIQLVSNNFLALVEDLPNIVASKNIKHWHSFLIKHGICMIYPNTYEKLIPQQVNYDKLGGVSFTKGCYTGQEIVARMHYLGKAKRLMYKFICDAKQIQIGQRVISPSMDNQELGNVVDIVNRDYDCFGLVSIQNNYIENAFIDEAGTLHQLLIQEIVGSYKDTTPAT